MIHHPNLVWALLTTGGTYIFPPEYSFCLYTALQEFTIGQPRVFNHIICKLNTVWLTPESETHRVKNMFVCHPLPHDKFLFVLTMSFSWVDWQDMLLRFLSISRHFQAHCPFSKPSPSSFSIHRTPEVTRTTRSGPLAVPCSWSLSLSLSVLVHWHSFSIAFMCITNKDWLTKPKKAKELVVSPSFFNLFILVCFLKESEPSSQPRK